MGILVFSKKNLISEFFLGLILLLALSLARNVIRVRAGNESIRIAQETLEKLKQENLQLKKDLVKVKSDAYVEKQSRNMLGLSLQGDVTLVLPDEDTIKKYSPRRREDKTLTLPDPIWKRWLNLFFVYK